MVCTLRRVTNFALDDLTFVMTHFLPHLNRDSIWRILRAEGLNRRPKPAPTQPAKGQGTFKVGGCEFQALQKCRRLINV
jgi:hypothetical protein